MKNKILVDIELTNQEKEKMLFSCNGVELLFQQLNEIDEEEGKQIEVVVGSLPAKYVSLFPNLKWLQVETAGVDKVLGYLPEEIMLTNSSGAYGYAIAEEMVGAVYLLYKKFDLYFANQKKHLWKKLGNVQDVGNSNVLVVGLGDIGCRFARRMHDIGANVIGVRRTTREKPDYVNEVVTLDRLNDLLPKADIVALALPATNETYHLFDYSRFKLMKKEAIVLNVGRGNLIKTTDFVQAINEGLIGGGWLDVTDPEPLPSDHPLWDLPRVIITPHVSGNYSLQRTKTSVINICIENINRYFAGQPLINLVDKKIGYRKNN